jgi:hypothetical protein
MGHYLSLLTEPYTGQQRIPSEQGAYYRSGLSHPEM